MYNGTNAYMLVLASSHFEDNGDYYPFKNRREVLLYILVHGPRPVVSSLLLTKVRNHH